MCMCVNLYAHVCICICMYHICICISSGQAAPRPERALPAGGRAPSAEIKTYERQESLQDIADFYFDVETKNRTMLRFSYLNEVYWQGSGPQPAPSGAGAARLCFFRYRASTVKYYYSYSSSHYHYQ